MPPADALSPPVPAAMDGRSLAGARILVVDDNVFSRELAMEVLAHAGAVVLGAGNGQEALALLAGTPVDCVLMDVQMPVMDGLQATERIRAGAHWDRLPILAMTATDDAQERSRCLRAGMDDFLTKPVLPAQLFATLQRWLRPREPVQGSAHGAADALSRAHAPPSAAGAAAGPAAGSFPPLPATPPHSPVIDLGILQERLGGDAAKLARFARLFADALPDTLAQLDAALARGDLEAVSSLGHRLKSSSHMVGALGMAALCQTLEALRADGNPDRARALAAPLPALAEAVRKHIEDYLEGTEGAG